jgi:lysophospholipase L1-like esterase
MIKPFHVLLTLLSVGAVCALVMLVYPKNGIHLGKSLTLTFPEFSDIFEADSAKAAVNVDSLLNTYTLDSASITDSITAWKVAHQQKMTRLQYPKGQTGLQKFFAALYQLEKGERRKVRILHYGDSQIEGDRITSYIREKLQSEFGGRGPGMMPGKDFIPNMSIVQTNSETWVRHTAFGRRDTNMHTNRYGLRAVVSRFTPNVADSLVPFKPVTEAWIQFKPSAVGYSQVRNYSKMRMIYGYNKAAVALKIEIDGVVVATDSLRPSNGVHVFEYNFESTPQNLRLLFAGKDSPDIYSISLEGNSGIVVDNIPMRGSSGTVFTQIGGLGAQYSLEPIALVILQYGGNTVPHITSTKMAEDYGRWFGGQIARIKQLLPNAAIVLIGPSDMSVKEKTEYVTYPYLVEVRDALKKAALSHDVAFWDMFEVMGGKNSMPSWVAANPPLAGPDYIHFTPKGARKVAELFYKSLREDYDKYVAARKKEAIKQDTATAKTDTADAP